MAELMLLSSATTTPVLMANASNSVFFLGLIGALQIGFVFVFVMAFPSESGLAGFSSVFLLQLLSKRSFGYVE